MKQTIKKKIQEKNNSKIIVLENILSEKECAYIYYRMLDKSNWYLSRGPYESWDEKEDNIGTSNPGFIIKNKKNGKIYHPDEYEYFKNILLDISNRCLREFNLKLPEEIYRIDLINRQIGSITDSHIDSKIPGAWSIVGMLSPEWKKSWGGGLHINEINKNTFSTNTIYLNPGDFVVFPSNTVHQGLPPINSKIPYWRMVVNFVLVPNEDFVWVSVNGNEWEYW